MCPHPQERINCLEGSHEFFEAIGFKKVTLPVPDQGEKAARQVGKGQGWHAGPGDSCDAFSEGQEFYVLGEDARAQPQNLERHKQQLLGAEPVRATLDRQLRVFRPSALASHFELPSDFFSLTAEEVKREQRLR